MAEDTRKLRLEERLKIKIGEAKNLPARSHGTPAHRDTYCVLSLDQEEIFRTSTMERTLNPFFGEEFQFEVPRRFRYLSIYVFDRDRDRHVKQDKVLGKVAIRREDLQDYNGKDHWFALSPVDADSEVQGKAHIEILFEPSHPRITSISPDCHAHHHSRNSPRFPHKIIEFNTDKLSSIDDMTSSNLSVDRKKSKKNITDYCKEGIKFGSSSQANRKMLNAVPITENIQTVLSRSESLRNTNRVNVTQTNMLHHTYGPSSSKGRHVSMNYTASEVALRNLPISTETYDPYIISPDLRNKLSIRVLECSELTMKNGQCDPYAIVTVYYSNDKKVSKRTKVKKKTVNPQFDECFVFDLTLDVDSGKERENSNNAYTVWPSGMLDEAKACEVCVSLWHDNPGMGGGAVFLGEVRAALREPQQLKTSAWYFLASRSGQQQCAQGATPPGTRLSSATGASLGSLRLVLHHALDRVLPSLAYDPLKALLLRPPQDKPITSWAVHILGEIVSCKTETAQPLVRLFTQEDVLVPNIRALAEAELSTLTDPTTIFRGNTLVSKMMDEAMRLTGLAYLQNTLRPTLDLIMEERRPCEIDPTRVKDNTTVEANLANLKDYVEKMFDAITQSYLRCPSVMCQLFDALRQCAKQHFKGNQEVCYSVVSGFIFLRFFAPAILGPRFFDLTTKQIDPQTNRTLTLISKTIQSLGNLVSLQVCKEEYMVTLYKCFSTERHVQAIKRFLEIISSSTETRNSIVQDTPVLLKEGTMIKKSQGKRFGRPNFKSRHFQLTSCELSYSKAQGKKHRCSIPLAEIRSAQPVPEHSLKMNNMFKIDYRDKVLFVQAGNCVERKEWLDLLGKLCEAHLPPAARFHPGAFQQNHWSCCSALKADAQGCAAEEVRSTPPNVQLRLDPARDLQRLHCLIYTHLPYMESLLLPPRPGGNNGSSSSSNPAADDPASYHKVLKELQEVTYGLEDKHRAFQRNLVRETKYGSKQAPIGDDNYLHLAARANNQDGLQQSSLPALRPPHQLLHISPAQRRFNIPRPLQLSTSSPKLPPKNYNHQSVATKPPLINDSAYLNNSLYIGSSSESVKNTEIRLSRTSDNNAAYLTMASVNNESDVKTPIECDRLNASTKPCEYVEVRPKIPERDTKPKVASLEQQADNPSFYCREYELMSNFTSNVGKCVDESLGEVPPAVPPRSNAAKYQGKGSPDHSEADKYDSVKKDGSFDDCVAEHKCLEHKCLEHKCLEQYQLKNTFRIKQSEDGQKFSLLKIVESSDLVNDVAAEENDAAEQCQDKDSTKIEEDRLQIDIDDEASVEDAGKKKVKEDTGFFSRKSIQRKSIPTKTKPSGKKTSGVDGTPGSSSSAGRTQLTDRLTPSFLKKKTKVSTDTVRVSPIC